MAPTTTPGAGSSASSSRPRSDLLRFTGHAHLRQRILLSVLSGRSIRIDAIRATDASVGLREYEINLLRLVEKVTNGTTIEISVTGTSFLLHPGLLPGGSYTHTCHVGRSIGYYLEVLVPLAPFCKKPMDVMLSGVTGEDGRDMTVDMIRTVTLPHLHLFGITDGLELQIKKRGAAPLGGGQVIFKSPIVRGLSTINFVQKGKIQKIRGVAYSTRVSPQFANRLVSSARSVLNRYIPDIYLVTDVYKGEESGKSPGYGLTLVSQSSTGVVHAAECLTSTPGAGSSGSRGAGAQQPDQHTQTPEEIALHGARLLLEELSKGGCVDSKHQWLVLLMMVLGKEDVGRCLMGPLTAYSIQFLRDLVLFFGTKFSIVPAARHSAFSGAGTGTGAGAGRKVKLPSQPDEPDSDGDGDGEDEGEGDAPLGAGEVVVSCVGVGYSNINKSMA